jgi:phage terminase large subunit GpA-like protein
MRPPVDLPVPLDTVRAMLETIAAGADVFRKRPPVRLGDWAAVNFYLSPEGSHTSGDWSAWPFQVGLLDWMGDDAIEELNVQKSKRVGYTKMLLARMAFSAAHLRRKLALWQPTDDDRDSFVKSEIEPMLRDVKALHPVMPPGATKDTIKLKTFIGAVWHLLGGKAARAYRRITLDDALLDEIDGFDLMIEKSSDPFTLAAGRLEGAAFPKLIAGSTPRVAGLSHIARRSSQATAQMQFRIACPHCEVEHSIEWTDNGKHGLVWDTDKPETARHVCPHCRESITQAEYLTIWAAGCWVDLKNGLRYGADRTWRDASGVECEAPRHVAAHIWSAYSPQRSWPSIAREYIEARAAEDVGNHGPMQGFRNETLGETWELTGDAADQSVLRERADASAGDGLVHARCFVVTRSVDVQGDRLEVSTWAWGRGMERQFVDHRVLHGDPASPESDTGSPWAALTELRHTEVMHANGVAAPVLATFIDSGGHHTQAVYAYARAYQHERVMACKGSSQSARPILGKPSQVDVNWRGQKIKRGVKLWPIGTDTAKAEIYGRLRVQEPGPGFVHLSKQLSTDVLEQLTSERLVTRYVKGRPRLEWVKPSGRRNEALDCAVYALAAAHYLGMERWREGDWAKWQRRVAAPAVAVAEPAPSAPTPAEQPEQPAPAKPIARARRRIRGRMGGWSP